MRVLALADAPGPSHPGGERRSARDPVVHVRGAALVEIGPPVDAGAPMFTRRRERAL